MSHLPQRVLDARADDRNISRDPVDTGPVLGRWYWVINPKDEGDDEADDERWLGCATHIGSNYVKISAPNGRSSSSYIRVHLDNFWERLCHEPNADAIIRANIGRHQQESQRLIAAVQELTQRLGMTPNPALGAPSNVAGGGALMVLSSQSDPKAYGRELKVAKETQLPELFKAIQHELHELARWMKAPALPMEAAFDSAKASMNGIDDRIFNVSLYAGLVEDAVQCSGGAAASAEERLHVMQGMAFMDEECLANYRVGGMEFKDIGAFDAWISEPENRDRILPFPRTLVAMRVRRNGKDRDWYGDLKTLLAQLADAEADKATFLYVRNGEQVWRIQTDLDLPETIFPDPSVFNPTEPKMFEMFAGSVKRFISVDDFEERKATYDQRKAAYDAWAKANPGDSNWMHNPHRRYDDFRPDDWRPLDPSTVYYDDAMADLSAQVAKYNRIALIIQGLFDRSLVLHPHPPVRTWTAEGFDQAVKLVYDATGVIHHGEPPDFEAYRARCNTTMGVGSMVAGQERAWIERENAKECRRLDNDWRNRSDYRPKSFTPYGDPGPGYVARVERFSKTKGATFVWERKRRAGYDPHDKVAATITVPTSQLFNIDAYTPGDFKTFFSDPRTRQQYLKWAPLLIAAEEYHAGLHATT